jgi:hypothetical protein
MPKTNSPCSATRRFSRRTQVAIGVLAAAGILNGCASSAADDGVEISAVEAAITARENTTRALRGVSSTAEFLAESATLADLLSSLSGTEETCVTPETCDANGNCPTPATTPEPVCTSSPSVTVDDLKEIHQDINDEIDKLEAKLRDEVFIDANLDSDDGTHAVYRIPVSVLCPPLADDASEPDVSTPEPVPVPPAEPAPDPECVDRAERYVPKLRLSSPGNQNIDVDLLLGAARREVASFQLYSDRLGVSVNLGELSALTTEVGDDLGGIESLAGKIQVELVRKAEKFYSLRYNILEEVKLVTNTDGESITVTEAARSPIFELALDGRNGADGTVTGTYDLGAVRVSGPLNAFRDTFGSDEEYDADGNLLPANSYTGTIELLLAGLQGSLAYSGNTDKLLFQGLGLGDTSSFLKHNGQTVFQLDLNPDSGRHFDLTWEKGIEHPKLTFSPTFDLSFVTKLQLLADQIEDIPSQWLDNVYHFWFEGADPALEVQDSQVKVVNGTLHLDTSAEPDANISITAGMCLTDGDDDIAPTAPPVDDAAPAPEPGTDPVPEEEPVESDGPFAPFVAGACQ